MIKDKEEQIIKDRIQQLINAIGLVKKTNHKWFKEQMRTKGFNNGYLSFSDNGNSMIIEWISNNKLKVPLSLYKDAHDSTKKYILEKLKNELTELLYL